MKTALLPAWTGIPKVVIGMCHLPALPGAPEFGGQVSAVRDRLLSDAAALVAGGVHGIMIENFGDVPFYPDRVPPHTVAHMAVLVAELRQRVNVPIGVNVLRNDGRSALAIADAAGADFIRVNILSGARVTDQGVLQSQAHELLRERSAFRAQRIKIFADVNVKESVPLGERLPIEDEVDDVIQRSLADAVIVSGTNTGSAARLQEVQDVGRAAHATPVFIGSGVTVENVRQFLPHIDGVIVGTSLKIDGNPRAPVETQRVQRLLAAVLGGSS